MDGINLPSVSIGKVIGFLEILDDLGGRDDVFRAATALQMELDDILPVIEAAAVLGLIKVEKGDAWVTEEGRRFLDSDINQRKRMICLRLEEIGLFKELVGILRSRKNARISRSAYASRVLKGLYSRDAADLLHTMIDWGRYAELIGYNEDSDEIYLDQPITL
ncbi:MAG: AAA-associated domain-containing protein [Firmicutes bacterium]|jgi:NitT/TauT family transport system ATP-binding protein|nr:AAA-associated domain-containing protein [Bacillota bacterium]